eukprot:6380256-Pyramimonas_sp.AAC.1
MPAPVRSPDGDEGNAESAQAPPTASATLAAAESAQAPPTASATLAAADAPTVDDARPTPYWCPPPQTVPDTKDSTPSSSSSSS